MKKKKDLLKKMAAQLGEWSKKIEHLSESKDKLKKEKIEEAEKLIKSFKNKQAQAKIKLDKLKDASEGAWDEVKAGAEKTWDDLKETFENARSKFDVKEKSETAVTEKKLIKRQVVNKKQI